MYYVIYIRRKTNITKLVVRPWWSLSAMVVNAPSLPPRGLFWHTAAPSSAHRHCGPPWRAVQWKGDRNHLVRQINAQSAHFLHQNSYTKALDDPFPLLTTPFCMSSRCLIGLRQPPSECRLPLRTGPLHPSCVIRRPNFIRGWLPPCEGRRPIQIARWHEYNESRRPIQIGRRRPNMLSN